MWSTEGYHVIRNSQLSAKISAWNIPAADESTYDGRNEKWSFPYICQPRRTYSIYVAILGNSLQRKDNTDTRDHAQTATVTFPQHYRRCAHHPTIFRNVRLTIPVQNPSNKWTETRARTQRGALTTSLLQLVLEYIKIGCERVVNNSADISRYPRSHGRARVSKDTTATATSKGRCAKREGGSRFNSERLSCIFRSFAPNVRTLLC